MDKPFVVIVTYNSAETIKQLLADLGSLLDRVVVIDNGSKDKTLSILKKTPKIKVIVPGRNTGCDEGTNIGITIPIFLSLLKVSSSFCKKPLYTCTSGLRTKT